MSEDLPKKRVFLYGQWVEVTVLPPVPTPSPTVTVPINSKGHLMSVDDTAYETPVKHRARRKSS